MGKLTEKENDKMTNITDVLHVVELNRMLDEKRIQKQIHPTLPLVIYNYTNRAQFIGEWTQAERVCRGLIVGPGGEIIARGPSKFFNYGQTGAPEIALDEKVWVSRKEDGSLGIGWYYEGHYGVATRGSFASDQALKANSMLTTKDKLRFQLDQKKGRTSIYEIVYPENRIVLDYKGLEKLIPLGHVGIESGLIESRNLGVLYSTDGTMFDHEMTFAEALALPIPDDEEGYVLDVRNFDTPGLRGHVKLKGDRYKELHGAIFGLSERKIWEALGRGDDMDEFVAALPDELMPWAQGVVDRLVAETTDKVFEVAQAMNKVAVEFDWKPSSAPRGEVARFIMSNFKDISGPLFSLLDSRVGAVVDWAHAQVRPEHKLFRVEDGNAN
jgi:RNA ligase